MAKYDWVVFFIHGIMLVMLAAIVCLIWIACFPQPVITSVEAIYWLVVGFTVGLVGSSVLILDLY